jgi:hypothetical protein
MTMASYATAVAGTLRTSDGRFVGLLLRCPALFLPAAVLTAGAVSATGEHSLLAWIGATMVAAGGLWLLPQPRLANPIPAVVVGGVYFVALLWLRVLGAPGGDCYVSLASGLLLAALLVVYSDLWLDWCGAPALRRARRCVDKLLRRSAWPSDLSLCQTLPEVTGLREAVVDEVTPALALLTHERTEVRAAALAALAYRRAWRTGEAERVQAAARRAPEPAVRAAAIRALANTKDPFIVETIATALRDAAPEVRRAAAEVLLWDGERRWGWVRFSVHAALADPELRKDGPLPLGGVTLPPQAVRDLHDWAGEGGRLGIRAAQTLVGYYAQILNSRPDAAALVEELRKKVLDPQAATPLRVELAQMLAEQRQLDPTTRDGLLSADNPIPVRMVGAESALATGPDARAEKALREIARRPNREIALAVAQLVQRRLGVDLGIDLHRLPPAQSRRGAEITRRVMEWAAEPKKDSSADLPKRPPTEWDIGPLP